MGDQSHPYHQHHHREIVQLPGGSSVMGCSFPRDDDNDGLAARTAPDFGLYLDRRWQPPWPYDHLDWPDFGLPADDHDLEAALRDVLARAERGQVIEIGCIGGHGRTGTALACLAVLDGLSKDPVRWVRDHYCHRAIETDEQADYARRWKPRGGGHRPD